MSKPKSTKDINTDEVRRKLWLRKRQLNFDTYPKALQEFLTRNGMNPYLEGTENRIEYREFIITAKEN